MGVYLDNFIYALQSVGGISVYWTSVLKEINKASFKNITLVKIRSHLNIVQSEVQWSKHTVIDHRMPVSLLRVLPLIKKLPSQSLFHSSYLRVSLQRDICNVVTVHDLAAELGKIKGIRRWLKFALQSFAIRKADGIVCISETTKKSLLRVYPKAKNKHLAVIHHGCSESFCKDLTKTSGNSILFIGGREEYKNFEVCVAALSELPDYHLLMIGGGKLSKKESVFLKRRLGERFSHVENVSTERLNRYYNEAFCLMYPSFYEGFGMPVLEAMKAGCPVIATHIEAIKEVAADAAILVKEYTNPHEFIKAIHILENADERYKLIQAGMARAELFSWEKHCTELINFYQKVYKNKFSVELDLG